MSDFFGHFLDDLFFLVISRFISILEVDGTDFQSEIGLYDIAFDVLEKHVFIVFVAGTVIFNLGLRNFFLKKRVVKNLLPGDSILGLYFEHFAYDILDFVLSDQI